jgi:hypothetical protein
MRNEKGESGGIFNNEVTKELRAEILTAKYAKVEQEIRKGSFDPRKSYATQ